MESLNIDLTPELLALVPVVVALLQLAKSFQWFEALKQWAPFIAIGIAFGLAKASGVTEPIMPSIIVGLVASGGYDLFKAPTKT